MRSFGGSVANFFVYLINKRFFNVCYGVGIFLDSCLKIIFVERKGVWFEF